MPSRGGQFRMIVMQPGPIPPSGGPNRERFLETNGLEALRLSKSEYERAVSLLGEFAKGLPEPHYPLIEENEDIRQIIQDEKRSEWVAWGAGVPRSIVDTIEPHIRRAVSAAMDALNYLEDHARMEEAHEAIHRAAFVKRGIFGCPITLIDDEFWTSCPINLSHLRMGVYAALISDFECSICGEPAEDCDHEAGDFYPKVAALTDDDRCSICGESACDHPVGQTFLVEAYRSAKNITTGEVSFVARPRYPLARIVEESKDLGALGDDPTVRRAARAGYLDCDADLGPCKGFNEMRSWDLDGLSVARHGG